MKINLLKKIVEHLESNGIFRAPDLSVIVVGSAAAKIMGVAEGLKKLFFQKWRVYPTQDLSIILKFSEKHHLRKIARVVAVEGTSAARADASRKSTNGPIGESRTKGLDLHLQNTSKPIQKNNY
ncbi:U4/U6 small nuclear ribonucleoprotein Prp31 [Vespula squamosa]|uniref:U4/U6 small nuclear ribonucleoprotein Prp31 n=2 Tax=Vespula squamosa TaxID=30214 RepID=A0ABD2BAA7_VESSQ